MGRLKWTGTSQIMTGIDMIGFIRTYGVIYIASMDDHAIFEEMFCPLKSEMSTICCATMFI